MDENRCSSCRSEVKQFLNSKIPTVLGLASEVLKQGDEDFSVKFKKCALNCCLHWTKIGVNLM